MEKEPVDFGRFLDFRKEISALVRRNYFVLEGDIPLLTVLLLEPVCVTLYYNGKSPDEIKDHLRFIAELICDAKLLDNLTKGDKKDHGIS